MQHRRKEKVFGSSMSKAVETIKEVQIIRDVRRGEIQSDLLSKSQRVKEFHTENRAKFAACVSLCSHLSAL